MYFFAIATSIVCHFFVLLLFVLCYLQFAFFTSFFLGSLIFEKLNLLNSIKKKLSKSRFVFCLLCNRFPRFLIGAFQVNLIMSSRVTIPTKLEVAQSTIRVLTLTQSLSSATFSTFLILVSPFCLADCTTIVYKGSDCMLCLPWPSKRELTILNKLTNKTFLLSFFFTASNSSTSSNLRTTFKGRTMVEWIHGIRQSLLHGRMVGGSSGLG